MAQIIDLGKLRFVWNGAYNSSTTYELNDLVKYGANVYVWTNPVSGSNKVPTNTDYWALVIEGTFPDQTGRANYILQTNGTTTGWTHTPILEAVSILADSDYQGDITVTSREVEITNWQLASTVATITTSEPHLFDVGDTAVLAGLESMANGPRVITGTPTPLSFTVTISAPDVEPTAVTGATATVYGNISTEGNLSVGGNALVDGTLTVEGLTTIDGNLDVRGATVFYGDTEFEHDVEVNGHLTVGTDVYQVTAKQVLDGTATLTLSTYAATGTHGIDLTDKVDIAGVGSPFDGVDITLTGRTDTTISYAVTSGNIPSTSSAGTVTVYGKLYVSNDLYVSKGAFLGGNTEIAGYAQIEGSAYVGEEAKFVSENLGLPARTIASYKIVSNVATITTTENHGYYPFLGVNISMAIPVPAIDGDWEIVEILSPTEFTIAVTSADVPLTTAAGVAQSTQGYTNPVAVFDINADDYAQVAMRNRSDAANASSDFIAYADNGDDFAGYIDMGITSSGFSDPEFTITGANDGYIFMSAPVGTTGNGDLVLATNDTGERNAIVFAAGGLSSNNTQMTIIPDVAVHIEIPTPSTSPTTGALTVVGGVGISGDMNIQGNVAIEGTITFGGEGTTVETSNLAVTDPMVYVGTSNANDLVDLAFIGEYSEAIPVPVVVSITNKVLTSNVATLTYSQGGTVVKAGDYILVAGVDATFNGTYLVTHVTANTFSYAKTNANVTSAAVTPNGTGTVNRRRRFSGIARDASDGVIKVFQGATTKPTTTVDFAESGISMAPVMTGSLTAGAASVSTLAVTSAASPATFAGASTFSGLATFSAGLTSAGNVTISGRLDVQEIREDVVDGAIVSSVFTADYSAANIFYLSSSPSANFTVNLINAPVDNGKTISLTVIVPQGATGYFPNAFQVAGVAQTLRWPNGTAPTPTSTSGKLDIFAFQLIRRADAWIVLGSATTNF